MNRHLHYAHVLILLGTHETSLSLATKARPQITLSRANSGNSANFSRGVFGGEKSMLVSAMRHLSNISQKYQMG
jgi:hypothetical protein